MNSKRKLVIFGGTGGLGIKLTPILNNKYEVTSLGSKDIDVTNFQEVKDFFNKNNFDIVINMSGKKFDRILSKVTIEDQTEIQKMLAVNINGNINILSTSLPQMIEKKYGRIISISSVTAEMNIIGNSLYSASKAFIDRLISNTNKENIKFGITCNSIQLGYWGEGMCKEINPKYLEKINEQIGLKRFGTIKELYNTINYIVDTEYVCGINLKIDGGI